MVEYSSNYETFVASSPKLLKLFETRLSEKLGVKVALIPKHKYIIDMVWGTEQDKLMCIMTFGDEHDIIHKFLTPLMYDDVVTEVNKLAYYKHVMPQVPFEITLFLICSSLR